MSRTDEAKWCDVCNDPVVEGHPLCDELRRMREIVRDLAERRVPSYNGTCLLCNFVDDDETKTNHDAKCPWRRAVEAMP